MNNELTNESELFLLIAEGNEDAFRKIFHYYNARLFPAVLSITRSESDAEEVIQNIFLKLWLNRKSLPEIENPGGWLYRVASNLALTALRDKATRVRHTQAYADRPSKDDELEQQLNASEMKSFIAEAAEKLPPGRRQVFHLSRTEGLDRKQIAEITGLSENTVKNQLGAALRFIQNYIRSKYGIYLPVIFFLPL